MAEQLNLNVILPTRGELKILNVLWELGQATVEEVIKHPSFPTPPNYKTTQTLLRIMEEKGLARHTTRGRVFIFAPCVTREQVTRLSVQNLLDQTFAGSLTDMMVGVIETGTVKESELEELEALIRNYRTQRASASK
ncbi:MAG TPA: BlaI/MecI/CopY family transcriptional regulator [Candidatus Acidoferrales bacterium]|jgi:predicted transcriptional regulator|nr:BlaI/MecI/CopY family transcriptional regulator [Candidatus Angelobacter sp.]HWG87113.1 BlaI/MecI/CopY family transcriptional regulator [Candidatus Acidoferrales bacterium]